MSAYDKVKRCTGFAYDGALVRMELTRQSVHEHNEPITGVLTEVMSSSRKVSAKPDSLLSTEVEDPVPRLHFR